MTSLDTQNNFKIAALKMFHQKENFFNVRH